MTHQQI